MPGDTPTQQAAPADQDVYVRDRYGDIRKGPASQVKGALDAGATLLSPQEVAQHEAEKQYSGLGNAAAAFGVNAIDQGLFLGTGKGMAVDVAKAFNPQAGQDVAGYFKGLEQGQGLASGLGTAVGVAAPAILSGGETLAAEEGEGAGLLSRLGQATAAPTNTLSSLGDIGESAARSLVGESSDSLLGRMAQNAIATGARSTVEGAALGAGQAYSDAEIDNHPLTAELLLAGLKKGAVYGGALGLGLGAAGGGLSKLGEVASEKLANTDLVGELGVRSAGARLPEIRALTNKGIDPNTIGRFMVDELPQYADKPFMRMTKEEMRDAATEAVKAAGEKIGAGIDELAAAAEKQGARPDIGQIVDRVDSEVIGPLRKLPGFESEVSQLEKYTSSFAEKGENATFRDLNDFRKALDTKIFKGGKAPPPDSVLDELWNARRIIEDEAEKQGASVAGEDWLQRYKGNKDYFAKAKEAERVATKGAERELGRNMVGLSDMIMAGAGMAHAGPLGILAGAAHHVVKEYGTQFVADMLNRASKLQSIKAVAAQSSNQLDAGLQRFLGAAGEKTVTAANKVATVSRTSDQFKAESGKIRQVASSPEAILDHVHQTVPPSEVAPRLAAAMASKHASALNWLNGQIPKGPAQSPLVPTVTSPPPRAQQVEWMQKHAVYRDPIGTTTKALAKGTLTHAHVDALRSMYPEILKEVQQRTMRHLAEQGAKGKLPSFQKRIRLGNLLGIPADASQSPSFVQSQQMLYAQQDKAASQSAGSPPPAPRNQRGARSSLASGEDDLDARA